MAVDNFVKGGDLIFIQEEHYFDGYTMMNGQTLHAFKKILRLKSQLDVVDNIKQWCRCGIVIDSDVEEIKYLLELTTDGFRKSEYVSRVLQFKKNKQIFGIRRLITPLNPDQSNELRRIADHLTTIDFANLYKIEPETRGNTQFNFMPQSLYKATSFPDKNGSFVGDDNKGLLEGKPIKIRKGPNDFVELVKKALADTRRILTKVDPKGAL